MSSQLTIFPEKIAILPDIRTARSGTFIDNMSLPIHRWFRYSAGFAAQWVEQVLKEWKITEKHIVLDPFVGSGTVPLVCDALNIPSVGIEAHPLVAHICKTKLLWDTKPEKISIFAEKIIEHAKHIKPNTIIYPVLIQRSFDEDTLAILDKLKISWILLSDKSNESELVWLALTSILRITSKAGTAQWQYILPNKTKKKTIPPFAAFATQIEIIKNDLIWMQSRLKKSHANIIQGDARNISNLVHDKISAVITSPPYANNYDYADALRFEMTFWGDVSGWGDIHDTVRKYLIVSSSQHSSHDKIKTDTILELEAVKPIRQELEKVIIELTRVRQNHGGKKHYHTMIGAYCRDISLVLQQLRHVCKPGVKMCWVIGDSAPYGVYCSIDRWIGELALAAGFKKYRFEKLRDRNIKWKNRKHRVPLKEGLLWIEG